ncbi:MAG: Hvo_1808 family surface protein, partial [Halobaculum sp.]
TLGWENGYWYNESIEVDQSDGVSKSERKALIARTMARVEKIRQLEFESTVPVSVQSRSELRQRVGNSSTSEALRVFDNTKFEAMFLINESADSLAVQDANRGSSILGYYSPSQDQIVLVAPNESAVRLDEITLAHELVHALQDQQFNLTSEKFRGETRDEVNAIDGVVEGDASYVEYLYDQRCKAGGSWNGTCKKPEAGAGSSSGSLANLGVYFLKFHPYSDGQSFVASIYERGGWAAVNDLYSNLPGSTEQVIEPSTYPGEQSANLSFQDKNADEWERVRPPGRPDYASIGQPGIASMIVYPLYHSQGQTQIVDPRTWLNYTDAGEISGADPLNYNFPAAEGSNGDRMHIYTNADNETAYVWRIGWESTEDVNEFLEAYRSVLNYWGAEQVGPNTYEIADGGFADAFHVIVEGNTVTIVNAPTVEGLSDVYGPVNVGSQSTATPTATESGRTASPTATPGSTTGATTVTSRSARRGRRPAARAGWSRRSSSLSD